MPTSKNDAQCFQCYNALMNDGAKVQKKCESLS